MNKTKNWRISFLVILLLFSFSTAILADETREAAKMELVSRINEVLTKDNPVWWYEAFYDSFYSAGLDDFGNIGIDPTRNFFAGEDEVAIENQNGQDVLVWKGTKTFNVWNVPEYFDTTQVSAASNKVLSILLYESMKDQIMEALDKVKRKDYNKFLKISIGIGLTEPVEFLINKGADIKSTDSKGQTLLHLASESGHLEIIDLLIAKRLDVNAKNNNNETPLVLASENGHTGVVKLLVEKGADVNIPGVYSRYPLHYAAIGGQIEVARLLIANGADVNVESGEHQLPLQYAVNKGELEMVSFLIDKGAAVNLGTLSYPQSPLWYAAWGGQTEVAKILVSRGAIVDNSVIAAAEDNGHAELGNILRRTGGMSKKNDLDVLIKEIADAPRFQQEKREKAITLARDLIPSPRIPEEARRFMTEGIAAMEVAKSVENLEEAEKKFQKATDLAPWWVDAYFNLALVQENLHKYYDSINNMKLYLLAAPSALEATAVQEKIFEIEYLQERRQEAENLTENGIGLYIQKNIQGAIGKFEEAIEADPEFAKAHAALAGMYKELGRFKEAIPEAEEGIQFGYREQIVYVDLAYCYNELGDIKKAIFILEEGVRDISGFNLVVYQMLGQYYRDDKQYEKALKNLEHVQIMLEAYGNNPLFAEDVQEVDKEWVQRTIENLKRLLKR